MPSPISRRNLRLRSSLASPKMATFPEYSVGSVSASPFSRPARRSLALRPAHSPNHPEGDPYTEGFSRLSFCNCSDCYRLERQLPGGIRTHWDAVPFHGARIMQAKAYWNAPLTTAVTGDWLLQQSQHRAGNLLNWRFHKPELFVCDSRDWQDCTYVLKNTMTSSQRVWICSFRYSRSR